MKGIVYILTNPAMPGIVKIGLTARGDMEKRMKELFSTGVPVPFVCYFACDVDNCAAVEQALHIAFYPNRIHPKREFFKIEPEQPVAILKLFEKKEVTNDVNREIEVNTTTVDREAGKKLERQRRPPLDFHFAEIPNGSELIFLDEDNEKIATVCSNRKVMYEGRERSLTELTRELLKLDYSVQPAPYWSFNGRSLRDIYEEKYSYRENDYF